MNKKQTDLIEFDKNNIWHPYTSMTNPLPSYLVESASGVKLNLADGRSIIDGMSSWWAVIHGYNNENINAAMHSQINKMSHVMFGGITHEPAIELCKTLVEITPVGLDKVFLSDSGSVSVEVAIKMAFQYWHSIATSDGIENKKTKLLTVRNGYHGDTFAAMSVCDPINGMHQLFDDVIAKHHFVDEPIAASKEEFSDKTKQSELDNLAETFKNHHKEIAAFIIEPIVQGAGGMRFYHPEYLKCVRELCDKYNVLLIADEIATGFGRTGKLFACDWANISPDILCLGKALTGGNLTLAATLTTELIATTISNSEAGCFMHGPTFMGNPLACAAANASLKLLKTTDWQRNVSRIEATLEKLLFPLKEVKRVKDVRVLGAIGVVEATSNVEMATIQQRFVELGVWIRPFGKLIYVMPPYITTDEQLERLAKAIETVLEEPYCFKSE